MKFMYNIIEELRADNSSLYKQSVLSNYIDNEDWKKVLFYTYNTNFNFYIKKIPNYCPEDSNISYLTLDDMFNTLDKLRNREVTGTNAINLLDLTLTRLSKEDAYVLELIIDRDISSGINSKSINKIYKGLLPETPYQRCSKLDEKTIDNISYPAILQKKADGLFGYGIKHNGSVYFSTRNGTLFECDSIKESMKHLPDNIVLMGEFILKSHGIDVDRKTGNGLINSYIKRFDTMSKLEESNKPKDALRLQESIDEWNYTNNHIVYEVWDMISYNEYKLKKSNVDYGDRLSELEYFLSSDVNNINIIETHIVQDIEEAKKLGQDYIDNGYEGAILKDKNTLWKDGTSKQMLKIKSILDIDLKCINVEEGTGRNIGKVGALVLESSCGKIKVKVGTGFNDKDRDRPFDYYIGKVIEVQYNELIKSKSKDTYSLFLPVFVEVREKLNYNSLSDVI